MSQYWTAQSVIKQIVGELGLPAPADITTASDVQSVQLLSLLNSAGNELMLYYPWEQFVKEWVFDTEFDKGDYDLPEDYKYFTDQTQWDRTDHWPLLGPKSAQEWSWLKGALVAALPRLRFRVADNQFKIWPIPKASGSPATYNLAMEYISRFWVNNAASTPPFTDMITQNSDVLMYDPWLLIKFVKFKFYELKGFATTGVNADFMRIFNNLTGKDTGAKILSLSPKVTSQYIGPWSVPDGSWNIYG
jgi:hypothetical protein